ncbi:MAG TPA: rRNA pseudouridine synthase [Moorella mulderi]|nr:rRNA pseudouridine synthase [Moorella mulderi]
MLLGIGVRLQKFLAQGGVASRRKAEELIRAGRVEVNGVVITTPGFKVDPRKDRVKVDGKPVALPPRRWYVLLYKPCGYISSARDPQGRPTVLDLVKGIPARLFPVGRLDFNSEGLILLTDDGELALRLTHPRYQIPKTYHVLVQGNPSEAALERLKRGVALEDGVTSPAEVKVLRKLKDRTWLEITLREGRKRQVRRMLAAVGHPVVRLKRVKLAFLTLRGLKPGQYRVLAPEEVEKLYELTGLAKDR